MKVTNTIPKLRNKLILFFKQLVEMYVKLSHTFHFFFVFLLSISRLLTVQLFLPLIAISVCPPHWGC